MNAGARGEPQLIEPTDAQLDLVRSWSRGALARSTWGARGRIEAELALAAGEPAGAVIRRLIVWQGSPRGYLQAVPAEAGAPGVEPGSLEVGLLLASERAEPAPWLAAAILAFAADVFSSSLALGLVTHPSVDAEAIVRAYEAAQFIWTRIEADRGRGPVWAMVRTRPSAS